MSPTWSAWELRWFYFHMCKKCENKYAGSLWQNYISGNVWKMMSDVAINFSFSFKQWFAFTYARNMRLIMPDLSRIITFQEMFGRWHQAWWKIFSFNLLTHWGWDKMAAIFQTTFSNAFSWMKMYEFRLRFHWSLFLNIQPLTISQHWFW